MKPDFKIVSLNMEKVNDAEKIDYLKRRPTVQTKAFNHQRQLEF